MNRKNEAAENVRGTGEAWLTDLSTADPEELFTLRKEAVAR